MIVVITGHTGSGKTWFMSRLMLADWKSGATIYPNFKLFFPNNNERVERWNNLDELYNLSNGVIGIDDGQKLFDARRWMSLPINFAEKIALHRHNFLDIYTTTQDLGHIDLRIRSNIHEWFSCVSIFRFPMNDRVKPVIQMIKITKHKRTEKNGKINWIDVGKKYHFISKFWTKKLYDTYEDIATKRFICRVKREKKKWKAKIYSRDLISRGKARL